MRDTFSTRFVAGCFVAAALLMWGGWVLLPVKIGTFFEPGDFARVGARRYMIDRPREAAAIGVRHFPLADERVLEQGIQATLPLLHTDHSRGKGLGWMAEPDWRSTVDLVMRYAGSGPAAGLETYYTNQFVAAE